MLTSLRAGSFPAAYCTITSVPPAIGKPRARFVCQKRNHRVQVAGRNHFVISRDSILMRRPAARRFRHGFKIWL
jgi:hypothetical protein